MYDRTRVTCHICKRRVTTDADWQEYGYLTRYECRQCTPVVTDERGASVIRIDPRLPMSIGAGFPYTHVNYDGEVKEGVTAHNSGDRSRHVPELYVAFPDGKWAWPTKWEL